MTPADIQKLRMQQMYGDGVEQSSVGPPSFMEAPLGIGGNGQVNSPEVQPEETELQKFIKTINQGYTPSTVATDKYNQLLNKFPQRQPPSFARALTAAGLSIGSKDPVKTSEDVMQGPYRRDVADWSVQVEPLGRAAQLENQANANERALLGNALTAHTWQNRLDTQQKIAAAKNALMAEKQNGTTYSVAGNKFIAHKPDGTVYDTGEDVKNYTPIEVANITSKNRTEVANIGARSREQVANIGAAGAMSRVQHPPIVVGGVVHNWSTETEQYEPVQGLPEGEPTKLGTPNQTGGMTNQDRVISNGAKMMLPHITELRNQAMQLEKRNLFGPVMSRIRGLAAKIGTSGDASDVEQSFQEFASAIANDPLINQSNDRAIGQFVTTLGLMASGTGARGGGSIQMIQYMKSLLSADSSLDMFLGRMDALDSFMKTYAIGPGGAAPVKKVTTGITDGVTGNQRIVVQSPDGKKFTLPAEQVDEFLKSPQGKGYQRVGK